MAKMSKNGIWLFPISFLIIFFSVSFLCSETHAQTSGLTVGSYETIGTTRISRTVWEYTYKATLTNLGTLDVRNSSGVVTSKVPSIVVVASNLSFGTVLAGKSLKSIDTFTIRVDRSFAFKQSDLTWKVNAEYVLNSPEILVNNFKEAVTQKNIDKIVMHFDLNVQARYRDFFSARIEGLVELSQLLSSLEYFETKGNIDIYTFDFVNGEGNLISSKVFLKKDNDNSWKIISF